MVKAMRVAVGMVGNRRVPLRQLEVADVEAVGRAQGNTGFVSYLRGSGIPVGLPGT